jgi:putative endopeptidase
MKKVIRLLSVGTLSLLTGGLLLQSCNESMVKLESNEAIKSVDLNLKADPKADFYEYANGGWMANNPLPEDRGRFGSFDELADNGEKQVKALIEEISASEHEAGTVAQKIGDFFALGMDMEKRNQDGISPLNEEFTKIEKLKTIQDVEKHLTYMHQIGSGGLFNMFGMADRKNSSMVAAYLWQGGLGMPDRDYYVQDNDRAAQLREAYKEHVTKMHILAGDSEKVAAKKMEVVYFIEEELAKASNTRMENRDPHATYNKKNLSGLNELCPAFDWEYYFTNVGVKDFDSVIVAQPKFFARVNVLLNEVSVEDWKTYMKWNLLNDMASFLSDDFVSQNFEFYGKALSGTPEMRPLWKRVQGAVNGSLSEAIGQLYVEKYFPEEAKQRMIHLVDNLKYALGERIKMLEWMDETTKVKAQEKLDAMRVKIGYPDKWKDYSGLEITKDSYVQNILRASQFAYADAIEKINKPVDKEEWHMAPQTVNAYYSPTGNEIVFPAAILQPPFFFMDADDAVNYGAIGVVIGHEMTHGFDDQGRKYDKDGNLNDWWSEDDAKRFDERAQVLVDQFNEFIVLDTIHADGKLTLGENIADLGGLNISYTGFMKAMEEQQPYEIDGFTYEQRFFLAYSHVWAQNIRDKEILRRTKEDVHSLGKFRVNGPLPNLPEFHEAFDITSGPMFLPKADRAVIW